jgi:hypothetical protein
MHFRPAEGTMMNAGDKDELRQADLSHLRLQEMTSEQRAELRRRYETFVNHFGGTATAPTRYPAKKPRVRKWTPGQRG